MSGKTFFARTRYIFVWSNIETILAPQYDVKKKQANYRYQRLHVVKARKASAKNKSIEVKLVMTVQVKSIILFIVEAFSPLEQAMHSATTAFFKSSKTTETHVVLKGMSRIVKY